MLNFYRGIIESILTKGIIVWYGNITVEDKAQLQRIVNTASRIIGTELKRITGTGMKRINGTEMKRMI